MDIFLIKKEAEIDEIIEDYFFTYIENSAFWIKAAYFQKNNMVTRKEVSNYYYDLPFIILKRLLKSIESGTGEYILNSVYIPADFWNNLNYNEESIQNYHLKYELFRILSFQIEAFINYYNRFKKINKVVYQNLCNVLIELQLNFSKEIWYINAPEYFPFNYPSDNNLDAYSLIYRNSYFVNPNKMNRSFISVFTNFLKCSISLSSLLNTSDMSNYDFDDESIEKEFLENKKMIVCKFYVNTILRILIRDIKTLTLKRIQKK